MCYPVGQVQLVVFFFQVRLMLNEVKRHGLLPRAGEFAE
jgi:hypothetical protein